MAQKPKRREAATNDYYSARSLLAECFGLNEDSEIPQDYDELPANIRVAAKDQEDM